MTATTSLSREYLRPREPGALHPRLPAKVARSRGRRYSRLNEVVAVMTGYSYADVVERLFREFGDRLPLTLIVVVVHECRDQFSGVAESAMSEMLERLARHRLNSTPQPSRPPTRRDQRTAGVASAKLAASH